MSVRRLAREFRDADFPMPWQRTEEQGRREEGEEGSSTGKSKGKGWKTEPASGWNILLFGATTKHHFAVPTFQTNFWKGWERTASWNRRQGGKESLVVAGGYWNGEVQEEEEEEEGQRMGHLV